MDFDAVTLSPYMGRDSIEPFLEYEGKWAIVPRSHVKFFGRAVPARREGRQASLQGCHGGDDVHFEPGQHDVRRRCDKGGETCRNQDVLPGQFPSCPGVWGAQGGSAEEVMRHGANDKGGLLINSSRGILYADSTQNFAKSAAKVASQTARNPIGYSRNTL